MSEVVYVKNAIVSMKWDAQGFFESKTKGFLGAVNIYQTEKGEIPVAFRGDTAFIVLDQDEQEPSSRSALLKEFQQMAKDNRMFESLEDIFAEDYIELCVGEYTEEETGAIYGLTEEDMEDIKNRIKDLSGYYVVEVTDMCEE